MRMVSINYYYELLFSILILLYCTHTRLLHCIATLVTFYFFSLLIRYYITNCLELFLECMLRRILQE